jgi:hypothetical protein
VLFLFLDSLDSLNSLLLRKTRSYVFTRLTFNSLSTHSLQSLALWRRQSTVWLSQAFTLPGPMNVGRHQAGILAVASQGFTNHDVFYHDASGLSYEAGDA